MKYCVYLVVLGAAFGVAAVSHAGVTDDEYVRPDGYTNVEIDNLKADVADVKSAQAEAEKASADAEKARVEEAAKERQAACDKAKKAAELSGSQASEKNAEKKCKEVDYATAAPVGMGGDAMKAMMDPELTKTAPSDAKFTLLETKPGDNTKFSSNMFDPERLKNQNVDLSSAVKDGTRVQTVGVDEAALKAKYDPANVIIGGEGSGMVYCGKNGGNCPGGKWGVNGNDGSYVTSLNDARNDSFQKWDLPQTETGKLNTGYVVDKSMPKGTTSAKLQVASMFQKMGESMGMDQEAINIAIGTANRESSFVTNKGPGTTSAWGYGQYVGDTWNGAAKDANGNVLNRNNSFNQAEVLLKDTQDRYTTYQNSSKLQSYFADKGGAGAYDYTIHYAGSMNASQDRLNYAVNYYNKTKGVGQAYADYAANGSSGAGTVVGGGSGVVGGFTGNSGLGTTVQQTVNGLLGGNKNVVSNLVNQLSGGNSTVANALNGLIGGGGTGNMANQALVTALVSQLMNGGGSKDEGSSSGGSSDSGSGSGDSTAPVRGYDAITQLTKKCGGSLPSSKDAMMLMIKSCQAIDG